MTVFPSSQLSPNIRSMSRSPQKKVAPGTCWQIALQIEQEVWPYAQVSVSEFPSSQFSRLAVSTSVSPQKLVSPGTS